MADPRRIEVTRPIVIAPVLQEQGGVFKPVPGRYAYYYEGERGRLGEPVKVDGKPLEVTRGDILVLPENHRLDHLDLRYRDADGQPFPAFRSPATTIPVTVENHGAAVNVSGSTRALILAGGNFTMDMTQADAARINVRGTTISDQSSIRPIASDNPDRPNGYQLDTGQGTVSVMQNTRLNIRDSGTQAHPTLLTIDGDERPAVVNAQRADMVDRVKRNIETAAASRSPATALAPLGVEVRANTPSTRVTLTNTAGRNPDHRATDGADQKKRVSGGTTTVTPDAPAAAGARPGGNAPGAGDRIPISEETSEHLQTAIKALQGVKHTPPAGANIPQGIRTGFDDLNTAISDAGKALFVINRNKSASKEDIKRYNEAMERAIKLAEKLENTPGAPKVVKDKVQEMKKTLEEHRKRVRGLPEVMRVSALDAVDPRAYAMLSGDQQPAQPGADQSTAMSAEAVRLLTSTNGDRGNPFEIPGPTGNTRQV